VHVHVYIHKHFKASSNKFVPKLSHLATSLKGIKELSYYKNSILLLA